MEAPTTNNPTKFKISIHPKKYNKKPEDIWSLVNNYQTLEIDLNGLKNYISKGHTIVPALLKNGYRNNKNFISSQVIFLDYDDNNNVDEEIAKINSYGINVNLVYYTFSHTEEAPRFRLCIILDTQIDDAKFYRKIVTALIGLAKSDASCKDLSRMFYAGTNPTILNENLNKYDDVYGAFTDLINKDVKDSRTVKKNIRDAKKCTSMTLPYVYISNCHENAQNCTVKTQLPDLRYFDYNQAKDNSPLFRSFADGTAHLKYVQLRNLITNLQYVRGGVKWIRERMDERGGYKNEDYRMLSRVPREGYNPEGIESFDASLIGDYHNILELDQSVRKNTITKTKEVKKETVEIVSKTFKVHFSNAFKSSNRVTFINAPTGLGKTETIINHLKSLSSTKDYIVAVPNHNLKEELSERMTSAGLQHSFTPRPPMFVTESLRLKYESYQEMGESKLASALLRKVISKKNVSNIQYTEEDIQIAEDHKSALEEAYGSSTVVLTTHSMVMLAPSNFTDKRTVIFDEDITHGLMDVSSIKSIKIFNILDKVIASASNNPNNLHHINSLKADAMMVKEFLIDMKDGVVGNVSENLAYKNKTYLLEALSDVEGAYHLVNLIGADKIMRVTNLDSTNLFHYGSVKTFDSHFNRIICLSATVDKWFCDNLIKNESFDFWHCGYTENITPIEQDNSRRYSSGHFMRAKNGVSLPVIPEGEAVITHKKHRGYFPDNETALYFGNTLGIDELKGRNVTIIGTPTAPTEVTVLKGHLMGFDIKNQNRGMLQLHKGEFYTFPFITFEDENLQNIEIRTAKAELSQDIGRARPSRTNGKVTIYSDIPMIEADIQKGKNIISCVVTRDINVNTEFIPSSADWLGFGEEVKEIEDVSEVEVVQKSVEPESEDEESKQWRRAYEEAIMNSINNL